MSNDEGSRSDASTKQTEQRRIVRSGCATALGLLALVTVPLLGFSAFGRFLSLATLGAVTPDLLVLYPSDELARVIAWSALWTFVLAFGLMATAKSWLRLALYGGVVFLLGMGFTFKACFQDFLALRKISNGSIELVYLWPRPDLRLDPHGAVVSLETTLDSSDQGTLVDRIIIEWNGTTYGSHVSGAARKAQDLLISLGATKGEARRAW